MKELNFSKMLYQDGLKMDHEGTGKVDKGETLTGLNPQIIENSAEPVTDENGRVIAFGEGKNTGVTAMSADLETLVNDADIKNDGLVQPGTIVNHEEDAEEYGYQGTMLLFGGDPSKNDGYFYVIPRNEETEVNVSITYDVVTIDPNLAQTLSDDLSKGISIQNKISKEAIFGDGIDFEPGKQYDIKIHLGMTSVKIEATVTPWVVNGETTVNLPNNQDPNVDPLKLAIDKAINGDLGIVESGGAYQFVGTLEQNPIGTVKYTPGSTEQEDMMNDLARFLGSLYRNGGIAEITYSGTAYTWNPNIGLKGSNWAQNADATTVEDAVTLVSQIVAAGATTSLTFTTDKGDITINVAQ